MGIKGQNHKNKSSYYFCHKYLNTILTDMIWTQATLRPENMSIEIGHPRDLGWKNPEFGF